MTLTQKARIAAAEFLSVAPARDPRVHNPDPAVRAALYQFVYWHNCAVSGNPEAADDYAKDIANGIAAGRYRDNPADWQGIRKEAEAYFAAWQ